MMKNQKCQVGFHPTIQPSRLRSQRLQYKVLHSMLQGFLNHPEAMLPDLLGELSRD
jgi:hypothetical protein